MWRPFSIVGIAVSRRASGPNIAGIKNIFIRIPALNKSDYGPCDVHISQKARRFYFGGNITAEDLKQFINLNSDVQFWYGTHKMIQYLAPYTTVYHYLMYFQDLFSFSTNPNVLGRDLGVSHADELSYMWDLFGLNAGTGIYDAWWSEANKLNSKRYPIIGHQKPGIFCTKYAHHQSSKLLLLIPNI